MDDAQLREIYALYHRYFYQVIAAQIGIGLAFGAIPLILSLRRGKRNLGIIAIVVCGLAGGISALLAIIVSAVFIVVVLKTGSKPTSEVH